MISSTHPTLHFLKSFRFTFISALLLIWALGIIPAQAALGITAVIPAAITNISASTITVTGSDFVDGAIVNLGGFGNLPTTFIDNATLTATVPAGLAAGTYDITVTNPDSTTFTLSNSLTIFTPSPTPTPEPTQAPFKRPVIVINSYSSSRSKVGQGQDFDVNIQIFNAGQKMAMNVVATFLSSDAVPRQTGGVIAIPEVAPNNRYDFVQPMTAGYDLWGKTSLAIELNIAYTDDQGNPFTEKFNLSIPLEPPKYTAPTATPTQTATPTASPLERPQLVITNYQTDVVPLQPGSQFSIEMEIANLGNATAQRITMIVGGGSTIPSTADPGGVPGGGGEFSNFAPLGSSNVQSIGDLPAGATIHARQPLIVNVSTNPGAYPMKISFAYLNENGAVMIDEQVITLLVYSLPNVEISFYRDPNPIFAGQPTSLPIQIVNLGRKSAILGNMTVSTQSGQITNNVILIGTLEAGGYLTLDANLVPETTGILEIQIRVDYTDDFNQARQINKTISLEVLEAFQPEPSDPGLDGSMGENPDNQLPEETFWQKVVRFILGMLGLDSARAHPTNEMLLPPQESQPDMQVVPMPPLKGP